MKRCCLILRYFEVMLGFEGGMTTWGAESEGYREFAVFLLQRM